MAKSVKKAPAKKKSPVKKTAKAKVPTKKTASKKVVIKRSSSPKPDVPKLLDIFGRIRKLMKTYEPPFRARVDIEGRYDLWSEKTVRAFGREFDAMYFAGLVIQSGYVGFYYMPIYTEPEKLRPLLAPELLKLLKGKSCFHVKNLDPGLEKHIAKALQIGHKVYKEKNGYRKPRLIRGYLRFNRSRTNSGGLPIIAL